MTKILYTSNEIRKKVIEIMADYNCKRTVVVAFVGDGAEEYLGKPKGIRLICWPQPGSTNPKTLQLLLKKGVKLEFCDKLHMKIYHSAKHGTVISSSNLTTNGLGIGKLKEAGVFLSPGEFDLKKLLLDLRIRKPREEDFEKLFLAYHQNRTNSKKPKQQEDFLHWLKNSYREKFKIAVFIEDEYEYATEEIEAANQIGAEEPVESFKCDKTDFRIGDWLLTIEVVNKTLTRNVSWMYIDAIVSISAKSDYKYRALQLRSTKTNQPPFVLTSKIKKAIYSVCEKIDPYKLQEQSTKPVSLNIIKKIEQKYADY